MQAGEAQLQQAGASSLDVRVDSGTGLAPEQITTLTDLPGVAQAVPLYEKRVNAGPAGGSLQGATVTLVGLQDSSAALRSVSVVAGRLPLPGSTSEVAIDEGLSTTLTGGFGSPIKIGQKIQMITGTGPDLFQVVGFTSGTSGGPSFTRDAVFVDDAAMLGPFGLGLHTPLVALRFAPGATVTAVSSRGARQVRIGGDHLRSPRGRIRTTAGSPTPPDPRHGVEPDRGRRGDRQQRRSGSVRAPSRDRIAPRRRRVLASGVPAVRHGSRHRGRCGCTGRHRRRPGARCDLQQQPLPRRSRRALVGAPGGSGARGDCRRARGRADRRSAPALRGGAHPDPRRPASPSDRRASARRVR